ncbi:MAG: hypothetical protein ABIL05_00250, partial [candidate division WOR-3 bacterium]
GRIYVIGGTDRLGLRCNKVYEYNPATNIWTLVNSAMITARSTLMPDSVTASGRSFIFTAGGAGPGTPQEVNVAEFYNTPPTNTWISETPMNYARFALGFARVDSFVYAIGGTYDIGAIPYNYNERGHYVYVNVIVDPDQSDSTDPGVPKYYRLQVTNNGWRTDTIDITTSGTISTWTVARLRADSVTPLPDTDGDGIPDTGPLARGQSTYIVIRLTPPSNAPAGQIDLTTVTGRSSVDVNIFDIALLTTRVKLLASILVDPNQSDSLFPGDSVRYPLTVTNNGNIIDTISLVTVRTLPNWTARLVDSSGLVISRIAVNPFGARRGFFCWIKAPTNALGGTTDLTTVRGTSCWRTTVQDSAILSTRVKVRASILVDPDQSGTIASGDSIRYPVDVINNGNANDTVSFVTNGTISGWSARVCDSNGVTISRIAVAALGGRRGIFTWIKSPSNAPAGRTDTTRLVGTSRWSAAVRDSAILRTTIRLTASIIVDPDRQGTVRPRDSTEYSLYVVNNGNATDSILLTTGRTRPWARAIIYDSLHRVISYVKLAPFGGRQNIILQIKADSTAIAGWTDTTILRGQSTNIPTTRDSAIVRTTVIPVTNIIVDPDRQGFVSRFDSIWYNHYIENRGNTRDSIPLFTRGTRPTWRAQIWDSARTQIINNVVLNPGQRKTVYLKIKPDTNSQYRNADTTYLVGYSTSGTARDSARDITEITLDARILVDPDQQNSILPGDSIYYYLYVKNQGNARDTILLSNDAPPPGWTVTIQDSIGNTINRVVLGPIRDSIRIRAKIKSPSNAPMGFADTTFVKGVSRNISTVSDSARLITIIMPLARIIVDPDSQASAAPAETVRYYLNVINQGNATDSILLTRTDTRPSWHSFICDSTGTTQIGYVKLPPQGGRIKIMTKVVSPDTAQAGAVNTTQVIGTSTVVPTVRDTARLTTTIRTTARIIVDPNQASNTIPRQTVRYYLDVINQGNNTDSILLSTANTRPFWNALIYDSAGTNQLTFVKLPGLGGRTKIRVDITPPDTAQAPAGIKDTTYVIGTSTNIPGIKDSARLITTIDFVAGLIIRPDQSGRTLPGRSIDYFLRSINRGNGPDSVNLTRYRTRSGWTAQLLDSTGTNPITRINLGPYNDSVKFILRITPPINVPPTEVDTTIVRGTSITNSSIYDTAIVNTYIGVQANIIVDPDQQANSMPGDTVRYFVNVINDGNATDSITLRTSHTSVGWYAGIFDSTGTIPRTYVRLPPFGGRATIMIKIRSPNNAPQGMSDTTFIHGHSTNDSTVTDSARLITTITGFARIIVDPDRIGRTNPGVTITYLHSVTNLGTMRDSINLLSRGTRSTWLRQIRDSAGINPVSFVVLNPGEARWLTLLITPPNNAGTTDVDTSYLIGVSSINNTVRDSAQDITQINRLISGLNIESNQQATIPSRQTKVYNLTAVLIGNAPDTVELKTKNTRTGWTAT